MSKTRKPDDCWLHPFFTLGVIAKYNDYRHLFLVLIYRSRSLTTHHLNKVKLEAKNADDEAA